MSDGKPSIQQLLALARQRGLWPEVALQTEPPLLQPMQGQVNTAPQPDAAEAELSLRTVELRDQISQALGSKQAAVQPMLDELGELFAAGAAIDLNAAWAALDELEDQLEALSR